jgi:hypothetical protein
MLATILVIVFCFLISSLKYERLKYAKLVVLYGCESWSLAVKGEHRLRLFEDKVLRILFVPKREEVAGGWRRHNEEFHNVYTSPNVIWVIKSMRMR